MLHLREDTMTVLGVVSAAVGLCLAMYIYLTHLGAEHQSLIASEIAEAKKALQAPKSDCMKAEKPPNPKQYTPTINITPFSQAKIRARHIHLVQRDIVNRLRDVDTFFQTRDLSNSARMLAHRHAENNKTEYNMMMDRVYNVPVIVRPPILPEPIIQHTPQGTPWIPAPGSYDPFGHVYDDGQLPAYVAPEYVPTDRPVETNSNEQRIRNWLDGVGRFQARRNPPPRQQQNMASPTDETISINSQMSHISI
jgi:hypothetical protein